MLAAKLNRGGSSGLKSKNVAACEWFCLLSHFEPHTSHLCLSLGTLAQQELCSYLSPPLWGFGIRQGLCGHISFPVWEPDLACSHLPPP